MILLQFTSKFTRIDSRFQSHHVTATNIQRKCLSRRKYCKRNRLERVGTHILHYTRHLEVPLAGLEILYIFIKIVSYGIWD